jgi:hypothetical protein
MAASRPLRPVGESNNVISLLITGLNADVCQSEVDRFVWTTVTVNLPRGQQPKSGATRCAE